MSKLASPTQTAAILSKGKAHHRAGHHSKALKLFTQVLEVDPTHAEALHLLALIARQTSDHATAASLLHRAIASSPTVALYHRDLAQTHTLLQNRPQAIQSYRDALTLDPTLPEVTLPLASLLVESGDPASAIRLYEQLLERTPDSSEILFHLGCLQQRHDQRPAAIDSYRKALTLRPNAPDIHFNLAATHFALGQFAEAVESYKQVLALQPNDAEAHYSLGVALQEHGDPTAAAFSYRRAITLRPTYSDAFSNLGATMMELGDLAAAEQTLRHAISLAPTDVNAHCNLGSVLHKQGDTVAAIVSFRTAFSLNPHHLLTLCNFGTLLDLLGENNGAAQCYRAALIVDPTCAQARFSLATQLLAAGDLAAGWRDYEARWDTREFRPVRRTFAQTQWRGEDLHGASIFIHSEQGFGDTLQFARFLPLVAARASHVVFEVPPALHTLLRDLHPNIRVVPSAARITRTASDWHCPLLSLPLALNITLENLPAEIPYLHPDPTKVDHWRNHLASGSESNSHAHPDSHAPAKAPRIGLVWSGNPKHSRDAQRSVSLNQLLTLTPPAGTTLYSLQKGLAAEQCANATHPIVNLEEHLNDFSDTAAILANLDLLITVDTAVAHLAAALGIPTWLLIHNAPDWRWLRNRTDSPWYPTVRLFRQKTANDWTEVFAELQQALNEMKQR